MSRQHTEIHTCKTRNAPHKVWLQTPATCVMHHYHTKPISYFAHCTGLSTAHLTEHCSVQDLSGMHHDNECLCHAVQLHGDYQKGYFHTRDQKYTQTMKMQLKVGMLTMRAAFSHIPFWQSAMWMGQQIVMQPCQGNTATGGSVVEQMEKVCLAFSRVCKLGSCFALHRTRV